LQNAELLMLFRNGFEISQWCAVITPKQGYQLAST
jgi:hypothetical protein